jgi:hypothetical protein
MPEYTYYEIVCKNENIKDCYVGKTTNFKKRVRDHKSNCYNENRKKYNYKLYEYIRENGGINNWEFIEIEKGEYDNEESALKERELIEKFNATLNNYIPTRKKKEWDKDNKKKIKEYQNEFRENNREILNEKRREKITCKCGCEITKSNLSTHLKTQKHIKFLALTADII